MGRKISKQIKQTAESITISPLCFIDKKNDVTQRRDVGVGGKYIKEIN